MTTMPTTEELTALERLAERLFKGKAFPDTVRSVDTAFAILLKGWELGMPAMAAAAGIAIVSGKVSLGADATAGACLRHRDICLYFSLVESTGEVARYETRRAGAPAPVVLAYTFAQAKTAGLTGSTTWQKHAPAMLRARCAAALARAVYPDLVAGCYDPDEAREISGEYARTEPVAAPSLAVVVETAARTNPRDLSSLGVEAPLSARGRDHVRDALAAVGGDNPTLGEFNTAVAEAHAAERRVAFTTPGLSDDEFAAMLSMLAHCETIEALDATRAEIRPDVSTRATAPQRAQLRAAAEARRAALAPTEPTPPAPPRGGRKSTRSVGATGDATPADAAPSAEALASIARVGDPYAYLATKHTYTEIERAVVAHGAHVPALAAAAVARLEALGEGGDESNRTRLVAAWVSESASRVQHAERTASQVRRAA
jgi:hypothetical protein